jgi:UDP-N-acetylmuramoylalanine--D-glutamate ligase
MNPSYLIVGLGQTGLSVARFLLAQHQGEAKIVAYESDPKSNNLVIFKSQFPQITTYSGVVPKQAIEQADIIVVSPGVPLDNPEITCAKQANKLIIGDIELFARYNTKPIIAVTGSNGKSTVVSLLGEMAMLNDIKAAVMGNIGRPVLELLQDDNYDLAIIELSSFQLETTFSLHPQVAVLLNITEDHLDRHKNMADYTAAKQRVFQQAKHKIFNADDLATQPSQGQTSASFSLNRHNEQATHTPSNIKVDKLRIRTRQYIANVLAAMAVSDCMQWQAAKSLLAAEHFQGLPHRLRLVKTLDKVAYYNDSKATNVGAALAAIESVAALIKGKQVLIMGGAAKSKDFSDLRQPIAEHAKAVILLGRDAKLIEQSLPDNVHREHVADIPGAVRLAKQLAEAGDAVVLAPACTSWDMFKDYQERGEQFEQELN